MAKFPKWLNEYIEVAQEALGLGVWEIHWELREHVNCENPQCVGMCEPWTRYFSAKILLDGYEMRRPTNKAKVYVLHELCHLIFAGMRYAANQTFAEHLKKKAEEAAFERVLDAEEQAIVRLSRALLPLVELKLAEKRAAEAETGKEKADGE